MNYKDLIKKISAHYSNNLPFVLFSSQGNSAVNCYLQNDDNLYLSDDLSEAGFIIAPFTSKGPVPLIPKSKSSYFSAEISAEIVSTTPVNLETNTEEKSKHIKLVSDAIATITDNEIEKIVLSRRQILTLKNADLEVIFDRLLQLYPNAFCYVFFHPEIGMWMGATPEVLLSSDGIEFTTMALAGTKPYEKGRKPDWTYKELKEQKIVVDAVAEKLQRAAAVLKVSKTTNHIAGSIVHLRTDFTGILRKNKFTLKSVVCALHPTPAVCGTPEKEAKNYILEHEGYPREYYTGFLGLIKENKSLELYVNLRCMKLMDDKAQVFIGGGITENSIPQDEWEETQNKLQTMSQVLAPFL